MHIWNFSKKIWKSHLVELEKLENDIQDQIGPCKSVGVRNRPQRDQFSQYFGIEFEPQDGVYELVFFLNLIENKLKLHRRRKNLHVILHIRSFHLFSIRLRKQTSPYTPSCGSNSMPKYCENWSLWGRFLTPTIFYEPIWAKMSFSNFSSSTRLPL